LKLIFSDSDVAGNSATGQVTSERRKKPFQLARGAICNTPLFNSTLNIGDAGQAEKCRKNESFG
jgi:hypothetical protein